MNHSLPSPSWIKANWFVAAALLLAGTDLAVLYLSDGASPRLLEFGLLSELCIVLPGLYLACYWRNGKRSILRAIALASLGFLAASKLLPGSGQFLIQQLWPIRYVALAVLVLIELKVMLAVYRAIFSGASRQEAALWSSLYKAAKAALSSWRR